MELGCVHMTLIWQAERKAMNFADQHCKSWAELTRKYSWSIEVTDDVEFDSLVHHYSERRRMREPWD